MAFGYDSLSPIRWISDVRNPTDQQKVYVKSPSTYDYELEDVSESDAGRTEDAMMHKKRIGQVNKINLAWQNIRTPVARDLISMFQPEYFYVNFLDPLTGTYHTEYMYRGNVSASMYSHWDGTGVWTVSFNLIRKDGGTMIA